MIGPRSALFAPFPDLGLIVIDEEHETSYKSEVTPRYHARETAVRRAGLEHAHVVMGSATPSVDASYACSRITPGFSKSFQNFVFTEFMCICSLLCIRTCPIPDLST